MRTIVAGLMLSAAVGQPAYAQLVGKAETLAYVSQKMRAINNERSSIEAYAGGDDSYIQKRMNKMLNMMSDLQGELVDNPYVQVTPYSVSVPWSGRAEIRSPRPKKPLQLAPRT